MIGDIYTQLLSDPLMDYALLQLMEFEHDFVWTTNVDVLDM